MFWSKIILFCQEYRKKVFSDMITPKNPNEKSSIFEQKPYTNPSEKCCFWHFIEFHFSGLKIILFYPKDKKNDLY